MSRTDRTVCIPRLSLAALAIVRLSLGSRLDVRFDDYALYAKVLLRWLRVPESWVLAVYSAAAGGPVRRLPHGRALADKGRLNLRAMQVADDLCDALEPSISESRWTAFCADFLDAESALAFALKRFAYQYAWSAARTLVVARAVIPADIPVTMIWSPLIPEPWLRACGSTYEREGVRPFSWPAAAANFWSFLVGMVWPARIAASALFAIVRQGVQPESAKPSAVVAVDLADPRRMGGGYADYDYWIDGRRLRREDVLFFSLPAQRKLIKSEGFDFDDALSRLAAQGYRIVELRRLPFAWSSVRGILRALTRLPKVGRDAACMGFVAHDAWTRSLAYVPLFDHYSPRNVTHCTNPNGFAPLNLDSGIITGLCRRRGSRGVGYQNRIIYDTFEYDHECYDVLLAWGAAWWNSGRRLARRVRSIVEVGSSNLAGLNAPSSGGEKTVVLFTTDPEGHLVTNGYHHRLLRTFLALARRHPRHRFVVKTKDIEDIDLFLGDPEFRQECDSVQNLTFVRLARHQSGEILRRTDIAIAAAIATPGADALLAGKPVIFYSEIGRWCEALDAIPGVVARTPAEFEAFFDRALSSLDRSDPQREALLRRLDPYRDGLARERIIATLLEAQFP